MNCEQCRTAVSLGEDLAGFEPHLSACEACRTWVESLDAIRVHAPALVGAAPEGLADRVIAHVATVPPIVEGMSDADAAPAAVAGLNGGDPVGGPGRWSRLVESWAAPKVAAAAAVGVLATAVVVAQTTGTPPGAGPADQVLAAAAYALNSTDASGFHFDVEGSMSATFVFPELEPPPIPDAPQMPELPSLPELPPMPSLSFPVPSLSFDCTALPLEVRARCEVEASQGGEIDTTDVQRWFQESFEQARQEWEARRQEVRTRINEQLAEARAELARVAGEAVTFTQERNVLSVSYTGQGRADGRGGATAEVDYRFDAPVDVAGTLEVTTVDDVTYLRSRSTGGWIRYDGRYDGFHFGELTAPRDPSQLLDLVAGHDGPVEDLGERDLDGVRVRGLRIDAGRATVTAWVGIDDGHLRQFEHVSELGGPEGTRVESRTLVRIRDIGADVTIEAPSDWRHVTDVPHEVLPPFHTSIDLDLTFGP